MKRSSLIHSKWYHQSLIQQPNSQDIHLKYEKNIPLLLEPLLFTRTGKSSALASALLYKTHRVQQFQRHSGLTAASTHCSDPLCHSKRSSPAPTWWINDTASSLLEKGKTLPLHLFHSWKTYNQNLQPPQNEEYFWHIYYLAPIKYWGL